MKSLVLLAGLVAATSASAHLQTGTYTGTTRAGEPCSFLVEKIEFVESRHPLNERVTVVIQNEVFVLSHDLVIDPTTFKTRIVKDILSGTKGRESLSMQAMIAMDHSPGRDGPVSASFMVDDSKSGSSPQRWMCGGLVAPLHNDSN